MSPESGTEQPEAVVCPNPECHIDQRWTRRGVLCCPECASKLVIGCEMCNSGAVERVGGSPRCSDHIDATESRTIYIASDFSLADRVQRVYEALEAEGHEVPDVWWNEDLKQIDLPDGEWYQHPDVEAIAERHWNSIEEAGTYVLVCPQEGSKKYNGANVELGYAHANGLDCYSLGELERSAMYVPVTRVGSIDELIDELKCGVGPGAGRVECPECGGDGLVRHGCTQEECPICDGGGEIPSDHWRAESNPAADTGTEQ